MSGTYKDLEAWQCAMALVLDVYRSTARFPREEMFGLTAQLRRAAVSVASNTAEGKGRFSDRELSQFLAIARGRFSKSRRRSLSPLILDFLPNLKPRSSRNGAAKSDGS